MRRDRPSPSPRRSVQALGGAAVWAVMLVVVGSSLLVGPGHALSQATASAARTATVAAHPSARWGSPMVYDANDGYTVLFGGATATGKLADTWTYAAGVWTPLNLTVHPAARAGDGLAYDAKDRIVLLFGGNDGTSVLGDTWAFSGGAWTKLHPASSPSARNAAGMTYDGKDGYVVLFGGDTGTTTATLQNDTWTFSRGAWTHLSPAISPPARRAMGITYDATDHYVLLFGGLGSTDLGDSWSFAGGEWRHVHTTVAPGVRVALAMAFDAADQYVLLFGGRDDNSGIVLNDTWSYSSGVWTSLAPSTSPSIRQGAAMNFDAADGYVLLFGGNGCYGSCLHSDRWTFSAGVWS